VTAPAAPAGLLLVALPAVSDLLDSPQAGAITVRGGTIRLLGYGAGVLLSVVSAAMLFRHLGVRESGRYVLVVSLVTIAVGITEAGLSALGVRELVQRDPAEAADLLRNLLGLRLLLSTAGVAIACAYATVAGYGARLTAGAALAGLALLLQGVQAVLSVGLQARLRFIAVTFAEFVRQLANTLAVVALVLAGAGLLDFFGALILANVAGLVACLSLLSGTMPLRPAFHRRRWASLLAGTIPFAVAAAIAVVYLRLGLLMLNQVSTAYQTGLYGISFRVIEVLSLVPALVVSTALPIFSRAARDDAPRLAYAVQKMFDTSLLLGAFIALLLAVGAPIVIDIVGGARFHAAQAVLRWHALAICGTFAAQPFGFALLASGRNRAVLFQTAVALSVSVAATAPLAAIHGATGAAAAAAAAEWALAAAGFWLLRQNDGPRVTLHAAWRIAAAALPGLAAALLLPPVPASAVAAVVFIGLAFALRAVPPEILHAFTSATPTARPRLRARR
jgi:O-antigen/teichoic acid export membrane protein